MNIQGGSNGQGPERVCVLLDTMKKKKQRTRTRIVSHRERDDQKSNCTESTYTITIHGNVQPTPPNETSNARVHVVVVATKHTAYHQATATL